MTAILVASALAASAALVLWAARADERREIDVDDGTLGEAAAD